MHERRGNVEWVLDTIWLVILAAAVWLLFLSGKLWGAPADSVVRIPSHGLSGVTIYSEPGRSLILSAGHGWQGQSRGKAIVIDVVPGRYPLPPKRGPTRLLQVDYGLDLALIDLPAGPLPYVSGVAPRGYRPGQLVSAGFDKMRVPVTVAPATVVGQDRTRTYTAQQPIPGRSGGPLLDYRANLVVGITTGYETSGSRRGIYSSLGACYQFLDRYNAGPAPLYPGGRVRYSNDGRYQDEPFEDRGFICPFPGLDLTPEPKGRPVVGEHYDPPPPQPGIPQVSKPWVSEYTDGR